MTETFTLISFVFTHVLIDLINVLLMLSDSPADRSPINPCVFSFLLLLEILLVPAMLNIVLLLLQKRFPVVSLLQLLTTSFNRVYVVVNSHVLLVLSQLCSFF